jgi:BirA family transcriptional regulator, biotin operon repressor / biotin---[acetyl-CoA-carboxylase] ligase
MSDVTFDLSEATGRVCKRPNFGWDFIPLDSVDSTQTYAKEHCEDFVNPTLIVANHQTAGRGRGEHTWEDDGGGRSFLSTWSLDLMHGAPDPRWTLGIGLYLYEALSEAFRTVRFSLKEPNDIYIGDKKVGGIIVESSSQGDVHNLHVGVGINVFSYPAEHGAIATHLNAYLGTASLTAETWSQFIEFFGSRLLHFENKAAGNTDAWLGRLSARLVDAMNRHPSHSENPVKQVQGDGTLVLERGQINWQEL